ncbi:MAG: PEP-CTERM sorting domain-containing protein [Methylobacteriaceae bacterium]|nr:PEP-CTERM sorting domain-containing protein [Methylobacteriaceae bacterium]
MKKIFAAVALVAASALASPASAALNNVNVTVAAPNFQGGGAGFENAPLGQLAAGYSEAGLTFQPGSPTKVKAAPSDGEGAFPFGDTSTQYLSVLGGSFVDIYAAAPSSKIGFYWGSVDDYNIIEFFKIGNAVAVGSMLGSDATPLLSNGNQGSFTTNRYVTISLNSGTYDYVRLSSTANSFEIDNISSGVPEPSTWAMMLIGFAGLAALSRRRQSRALVRV